MEKIKAWLTTQPAFYKQSQQTIKELHQLLNRLNQYEIEFVRNTVRYSCSPYMRKTSLVVNRLGDGWLYVIISILLLWFQGYASWRLFLASGLAATVSHCIYPVIKKKLARLRPCDYDCSLNFTVKVWDKYSFPSGHVMTFTAVAVPLLTKFPMLFPTIVVACLLIAWARISLGHHYPSDILFGMLLGLLIALPLSFLLIY